MSPFSWSLAIWIGAWLGLFAILEGLALADLVPWNTFSWTFAQVAARSSVMALLLLAVTVDLVLHLNTGWPSRGSLRPKRERTEGKR